MNKPKYISNKDTDVLFLEEMRAHAIKAFEKRDLVAHQMLLKMIEDWIDELKSKT